MRVKKHLDTMDGKAITTLWPYEEVGTNTEAKNELKKIFDGSVPFDTPKPVRLIERILHIATDEDSIILDSFAGSATTAQAVLNMNRNRNSNRKFILIEMMDYAETLTAERTRRVIDGYIAVDNVDEVIYDQEITSTTLADGPLLLAEARAAAKDAKGSFSKISKPKIEDNHLRVVGTRKTTENVDGTGGCFSFYDLGEPLMNADNTLNESVGTEKIRQYVNFMETKSPLVTASPDEPYLLGTHVNTAYYFYYERGHITTLNHNFLATVKTKAEEYVMYADLCMLSDDELAGFHITFKKIPRDISRL